MNEVQGMSFREFILLVQGYVNHLWGKALWILLCGVLLGALFVAKEWAAPINYSSRLTFMVNEDDNGSIGGVGAILGQFGLGGGSTSEYNLDKIVELGKSRRIVESILIDSIIIEEKKDLISNHLINLYHYHDKWVDSKNENLHDFLFSSANAEEYDRTGNLVLGTLYGLVVGNPDKGRPGLIDINYVDKTGILNISSRSQSEELSLELSLLIFSRLSKFYVEKSTEKQRETVDKLEVISDSLSNELNRVEYELATFQDRSAGILRQRDKVRNSKMQRNAQVLTIMYGEAVRNRETARFVLESKTPFFQVIDSPRYPLGRTNKFYVRKGIIGGAFGAFLGVVFFGFWKSFRDAMKED